MTTKVYLLDTKYLAHSLSCKQNIFMPYHHHQKEKTQMPCPGPILDPSTSKFVVCVSDVWWSVWQGTIHYNNYA